MLYFEATVVLHRQNHNVHALSLYFYLSLFSLRLLLVTDMILEIARGDGRRTVTRVQASLSNLGAQYGWSGKRGSCLNLAEILVSTSAYGAPTCCNRSGKCLSPPSVQSTSVSYLFVLKICFESICLDTMMCLSSGTSISPP